MPDPLIDGTCDPRFQAVRDAFVANFREGEEIGAAVAVIVGGRNVVDLWGGHSDAAQATPWHADTIACMMSVVKGVSALCLHVLVDRGHVDLDQPVARYWPAFERNGKERILVRHLIDHRTGLPAIMAPLPWGAIFHWKMMTEALAAEAPLWEAGTRPFYHSVTMGFLVGEVVRRVSGRTIGTFLRDEIVRPLELDYHIGVPASELDRCAEIFTDHGAPIFDVGAPDSMTARVMAQLPPTIMNTVGFRIAEIPSINGFGTARSIAKLYGALALGGAINGVRVISEKALAAALVEQWQSTEGLTGRYRSFGLGFVRNLPGKEVMGPNRNSFGHPGAGGPIGFADPDAGMGFCYVMNRMYAGPGLAPRPLRLVDAVYRCL